MQEEAVEGLQSLFDNMNELPLTMQKTIIVRALRKGAEPVERRMSTLAPDDPETPGSRLSEIMTTVGNQTASEAIAKIGPEASAEKRVSQAALAAEFGTAFEAARPYARPALDAAKAEATEIIGEVLDEEITQALTTK